MKTEFFSNLSLDEIVEILRVLVPQNLLPSKEVFTRLLELEGQGEGVEQAIVKISGGFVLRLYKDFKISRETPDLHDQVETVHVATESQHEFALVMGTSLSRPHYPPHLEAIRLLHIRDVPVFTMMYNAGQIPLANAYREYLFARY